MKLWEKRFNEYFNKEFKEYEFKHDIAEKFFELGYRRALCDVYESEKEFSNQSRLIKILSLADEEIKHESKKS